MPEVETRSGLHELAPLVMVHDMQRSVSFYCDLLGFEICSKWEPDGKLCWCRLERGGAALMLQQDCPEDGPPQGRGRGVAFFLGCQDVDQLHAELRERGLELTTPQVAFYGMKQVYFCDPDGYELCFQSPVSPG